MYRIIYLSSATTKFTNEEINKILEKSKSNNQSKGITGLLLYSDGNILQIIEGKKQEIKDLFHKISLDSRHRNIIKVFEGKVSNRIYPNWRMAFNSYQKEATEIAFKNYDFLINEEDNIASTFIETFLKSNKDKIVIK
ncbi:BLUF domain-containing protein [Flavobacterium sp. 9AF]|uniref:BLUF domain-containing protein n=1 Tax=Flavobacterium sp. 9AF TaxID=2653142 RepID=UPI00135A0B1B|nr:BLUF domain-containing protein [Flavobacterium sp. 9AF]